MKKLIVMLGAIACAVGVQAASVSWSMTVAGKGAEWAGNNAFVYAFNGSDYDAVIKLLTVDGSENMASDLGAYTLGGQAAIINNRGSAKTSPSPVGTDGVTGNTMFWVVFTDGSLDATKAITWTAATDVSASMYEPPAAGMQFALNAASFANTGTIASVPEPTSGLLMLVGIAGLALRRRRA